MPYDDDEGDDTPVGGQPPHPDDRLWRHPSELVKSAPPGAHPPAAPSPAPRVPRLWTVAAVSGLLGAVLAVGVVVVTGGFGAATATSERPGATSSRALVSGMVGEIDGTDGAAEVTAMVAPSLAHLSTPNGTAGASALGYRRDGYLITAAHWLGDNTTVAVTLADGTEIDGTVIGTDPATDIAVVRVANQNLPVATLGDTGGLAVGAPAIAVGAPSSPLGSASVSAGVVSGLGRKVVGPAGPLHGMVQTDAVVVTDASGGALCDKTGTVVGVLAAFSDTGPGYAVPMEVARTVADDIVETGKARHAWLGVEGTDLDPSAAKDLKVPGGIKVARVLDGSPAVAAGLQPGDVITAVDGHAVTSMSDLVVDLRKRQSGDRIDLAYRREGQAHTCQAVLQEH